MSTSTLATAATGLFALLLCGAAVAKLVAPGEFARTAARVMPRQWARNHPRLVAQSGRAVAAVELAASPIVLLGGTAGAGLAVLFGLIFTGAVLRALRAAGSPADAGAPSRRVRPVEPNSPVRSCSPHWRRPRVYSASPEQPSRGTWPPCPPP